VAAAVLSADCREREGANWFIPLAAAGRTDKETNE
jgi:hypothetical protein